MKRKASALEEPVTASDWNTLDYSSSSSASPDSVKAFAHHNQIGAHWNVGAVPYFNSRTRKRYRDSRPDEETVHQNTLAKLYNAQRQMRTEEQNEQPLQTPSSSEPLWLQQNPTHAFDSSQLRLESSTLVQPERNQKSIDSFFGGSLRKQAQKPSRSTLFQFSTARTTVDSLPTCEDCNATLRPSDPYASTMGGDLTMMDDDVQQDVWACASCFRRVCDTCAVQGDQRICLECAVPGGGRW